MSLIILLDALNQFCPDWYPVKVAFRQAELAIKEARRSCFSARSSFSHLKVEREHMARNE
jgi:hypothetical protein